MMEIEKVWELIALHVARLGPERVPVESTAWRMLDEDITADADQPPFDQSAVDGYALGSLPADAAYAIVDEIAAGATPRCALRPGEAARILTGAIVPEGSVAVVMQEDCSVAGNILTVSAPVKDGAFIRKRGAVAMAGGLIVAAGTRLPPGAAGLLASCGAANVSVVRHPKVLHLVTGDEICATDAVPELGHIRDSNGPLMASLLGDFGITSERLRLPDSPELIESSVRNFDGDILLISGGAGPGDRDHTRQALEREGFTVHSSRVNSRPGKPLIFATRGGQAAFGLPGNPLSHFVCFHVFVRRAICRMEGRPEPVLAQARLGGSVSDAGDGRRSWLPGKMTCSGNGLIVRPLEWKHSGDMTPLVSANALILHDPAAASSGMVSVLPCDDTIDFEP